MERLPWVQRKFHFDIPPGWMYNIISRLQGTNLRLAHYAAKVTEQEAEQRTDGKWSIKEHIGHLADLEDLHIGRLKDFEERRETLRAADMSNAATEKADHNSETIARLLAKFDTKRKIFIETLTALDDDTHQFTSLHPRLRENMRPVDVAFFTAEHDDHHLASIAQILRNQKKEE